MFTFITLPSVADRIGLSRIEKKLAYTNLLRQKKSPKNRYILKADRSWV